MLRVLCKAWDSTVPSLCGFVDSLHAPVILSEATASRMRSSRAVEGSLYACNTLSSERRFRQCSHVREENSLNQHTAFQLARDPSTALSLASRPPTPLRMTQPGDSASPLPPHKKGAPCFAFFAKRGIPRPHPAGFLLTEFTPLSILSEAPLRECEVAAQSKDPMPARSATNSERRFHHCFNWRVARFSRPAPRKRGAPCFASFAKRGIPLCRPSRLCACMSQKTALGL